MQNRYQIVTEIVPYSVFLWPWSAWRCILLLSDHFTRNMLTAYWIFFSLLLCIFFVCFWCFPFHSKLPLLGNWPLGKPLSRWILKLSPASLVPRNNFYNKMLACWKWWEMLNIDIFNHEKNCLQLLCCLGIISTIRCWGWICSSCAAEKILSLFITWSKNVSSLSRAWEKF